MDCDRRENTRQEVLLTEDAEETIHRTLRLLYLLPMPSLDRREQNLLLGALVPDTPRLVLAVVRALQRFGPEVPEVSEDPADLRALQERADHLADLRGHLDSLRLRVDEAHLRAQAEAARRARAVLQRVDHSARLFTDGSYEQRLRRALIARAARFDTRFHPAPIAEEL